MNEKEIQEALAFVRFNMACEGFEVTEEDEQRGLRVLHGEITGDEAVAEVVKAFKENCHTKRSPGSCAGAGNLSDKTESKKAWDFALAINAIANAPAPDSEYLSLIQQEINGEITTDDIRDKLREKYKKTKNVTLENKKEGT